MCVNIFIIYLWSQVVMSCTIKKDFQYNRVMPTFHHWKTGNMKYGNNLPSFQNKQIQL